MDEAVAHRSFAIRSAEVTDMKWIAVVGLASALTAFAAVRSGRPQAEPQHTSSVTDGDAAAARVPAFFERNNGQAPRAFRYVARHAEHEFAFAPNAVAISISDAAGSSVVELRFDGGRAQEPRAELPTEGRVNSLRGARASDWVVDVPTFERIRYPEVYRGIDAVFYAAGPRVEYDLVVRPHVDPSAIAIAFDGAASVRVGETGDLVVETAHGSMIQRKPAVYQMRGERRVAVPAAYRVDGTRALLALGAYDPAETLVIDPVIAYSQDFSASAADYVIAVAADASESVYAAGTTQSSKLPTTVGAFDTSLAPHDAATSVSQDAFVATLSANGATVIYATYLGGSGIDGAAGIAVDATGHAYVPAGPGL